MRKTFIIPVYSTKLHLIITKDATSYINKLHKQFNIKLVYKDFLEGMMFTVAMDHYYIVIDERFLTHNTIQHEQFHAVMAITSDRNIFEEEQRAWLSGYIGQQIYKFLEQKKVKIN